MPLRVLTPAPVARLVSLEALKASLGTTDRTDAELEALLKGVARAYANFLGWPLPRQGYDETASGNGRSRLLLSARPLDRDSLAVELAGTAITDFSIEDADHGVLYRRCAWPTCRERVGEEGEINIVATYSAGWIVPELVSTWAANDNAIANATTQWIRPSSPTLSRFLFEVTTAGVTGATEPTWPTTAGDTVTDGTAVLTARDVQELPADIYEAALLEAAAWAQGAKDLPAGITSESVDGIRTDYDFVALREGLHPLGPVSRSTLESYRC